MINNQISSAQTRQILRKHGLYLKKSLGQNFLIDTNILHNLMSALDINNQTAVLEIGPGIGALTQALAEQSGNVVAVELDERMIPVLEERFKDDRQVHIIHGDILKIDIAALWQRSFAANQDVIVAANLPYYITTPIVLHLLQQGLRFRSITVMVQKEVAERMQAKPGGKIFGSLSIAVQYYAASKVVMTVPQTAFMPNPHVDSAVLQMTIRKQPPVDVIDEAFFFALVRASFAQRRKTLFNNLASFFDEWDKPQLRGLLQDVEIDPSRRAETLPMEEFARLSNHLFEQKDA